jgi:aromatic-L-amino-acid decarboxylase
LALWTRRVDAFRDAFSLVPEYLRVAEDVSLNKVSVPLGRRFRALTKLWCAPRHFSLMCLRRDGSDEENEALLERVNASGEVFLSHMRVDDGYVLRLVIGNAWTTEDVRLAWDVVRREAG